MPASSSFLAHFFALGIAFVSLLPLANATSIVPPTWAELVKEAEAIHRVTVTAVSSRRVLATDGLPVIKTFVSFAVVRTLKGDLRHELTLEFLGGTVDGKFLAVAGMPRFLVGNTDYVFVQRNGVQFCPLVAMKHGRYRVQRDTATGREFIARDNGLPLTEFTQVALPFTALPASVAAPTAAVSRDPALTPAAFESAILGELQTPSVNRRAN